MIQKVGELLGKLGPLRAAGDFIGGIIGRSVEPGGAPSPAAGAFGLSAGPYGTGSAGTGGGVTIHAYGDPALIESAVVRALRRYDRTNGAAQVLPRWS
jgi:hypothetical protein